MVLILLSIPLLLFVTGPTLYDRIVQLRISSLKIPLLVGRGNLKFLTRFEYHRVLSIRTRNVDSSIANR